MKYKRTKKRAAADKSTTRVGPLATQHNMVTPQQKLKSAMAGHKK